VNVRPSKQAGLAIDHARLPIVEARDQDLGGGEAHHDGAVALAPDILLPQLREIDSGDHVAGRQEGELIASKAVGDVLIRLCDGAHVHHAHRRCLEAIEGPHPSDERGQIDLFLVRSKYFRHGMAGRPQEIPPADECDADHKKDRHGPDDDRFA